MLEPLAAGYPRPTSVHFRCEQRFFFRNVLLSIEQKAIGASTLMETEVFVWIFFCMNTDAYHPNGPIWLDYRFCYRPLLCGT